MYRLIKSSAARGLVLEQAPSLLISLLISSRFEFHSFLLEAGSFLAVWYVTDFVVAKFFSRKASQV